MEALALIAGRHSSRVGEPAPDRAALERALQAAAAAPDHKKLRPWRFLVVAGEGKNALAELLVRSLLLRDPEADAFSQDRERAKVARAPMVVVAAAVIRETPGVPEIEQLLAAGAATQNLVLALHAQGFSAAWKTGAAAYCDLFKAELGFSPHDHILGLIYVGTPIDHTEPAGRQSADELLRHWP